jgi:hypothetical protein
MTPVFFAVPLIRSFHLGLRGPAQYIPSRHFLSLASGAWAVAKAGNVNLSETVTLAAALRVPRSISSGGSREARTGAGRYGL